jgi:hypothetical protein
MIYTFSKDENKPKRKGKYELRLQLLSQETIILLQLFY